jgi:hypothetical protein
MDLECHEAIFNADIDIFEISHGESVSQSKNFENLDKIRCINGPGPATLRVDKIRIQLVLAVVSEFLFIILILQTFSALIATKTTTSQFIEEKSQNSNSRRRLTLKPKLDP